MQYTCFLSFPFLLFVFIWEYLCLVFVIEKDEYYKKHEIHLLWSDCATKSSADAERLFCWRGISGKVDGKNGI